MATNLSALSSATTTATTLSNLILVSPQKTVGYQPQNAPSWAKNTAVQPKALLFNYEGEQSVQLTSDITDHAIEDNTFIQDQIALKPVLITTQGFVGELNDIAPAALLPLKEAAEKLTVISAYTPSLSTTALLAYATAFQLYQVGKNALNSAVETWSSINAAQGDKGQSVINGSSGPTLNASGQIVGTAPNQTQQQIYFQQFYAYMQSRTLFTVQTPWAVFQDMAIQSLRAVQNAETNVITDFEITFKLIRFAQTQSGLSVVTTEIYNDSSNMQARKQSQGSVENNIGTSQLQTSPQTFSSQSAFRATGAA